MRYPFILFILAAAAITALLFFLNILIAPTIGGDTEWYVAAAGGQLDKLIEPYSSRFLHPFLVGWLSRNTPLDVYQGFYLIAIASIFLFFVVNGSILKNVVRTPLLLVPLFLLPYFFDTIREVFEPDPLYLLLTAVFFLFTLFRKESYGLVTLFLMFLARESTVLLGVIYAIMGWLRSKKTLAFSIIVIIAASLWLTGIMKSIGQPNIHNLSSPVYMVAKLSYNFGTNVLGLKPWINTGTACEPKFKFALPPVKSLGNVHEVGLCGFDFSLPLKALITLLTLFGIAPLAVFYVLSKRMREIFKKFSFGFLLILVYGLAHYVVGVFAGTGVWRIVGYGWPTFLIAGPLLLSAFFEIDRKFVVKLSLIQLLTAWLPLVVYRLNGDGTSSLILILLSVLAIYAGSFRMLKKQKMSDAANGGILPEIFSNRESLPSD